ncbi:hypothetical protein ABZU86_34670 [Streptomyces sp. NPDC005271]|uniref:hypothetical protein n=1 Tax=unclassified Streptomyces TaxID=2593676 RepID=UPI0033ACA049
MGADAWTVIAALSGVLGNVTAIYVSIASLRRADAALVQAQDIAGRTPDDAHDASALSRALTHRPHEAWTGITIGDMDPVEHLGLWPATTIDHFARLSVGIQARHSGRVTPALRWAGAAVHDGAGTLAYLVPRPAADAAEELGVIAHGLKAAAFAAHTVEVLDHWNKERPTQPVITAPQRAGPGSAGRNPHP